MSQSRPHLVIIDGLSFLFRAYHAVRPLSRTDGLPTNALYGFAQMLVKVLRELKPDMCCVALDSIGPTFRKQMYPEYKAHRAEMDAEMQQQMPYFEPLIASFGIPGLRVEGVEADDIIATLATLHRSYADVTIVSSDKDLMQLLGGSVKMLDTLKNKEFTPDEVIEKFGVGPDRVIDVQALIGDSSDNVPGVRSVGPKTAAQLITQFGSFDELYQNLDKVERDKLREALTEYADNAKISKQLVTLKCDVDLSKVAATDADLAFTPTIEVAQDYLRFLEFNSLAGRLAGKNGIHGEAKGTPAKAAPSPQQPTAPVTSGSGFDRSKYETITTKEQLNSWVEKLDNVSHFAIDTETTSLDAMQAELVGISLCVAPNEACYIPLMYQPELTLDGSGSDVSILTKDVVFNALLPYLQNPAVLKVGQNIKYDLIVLQNAGLKLSGIADTMIQSFVLHGGQHGHGMDYLAENYLGHATMKFKDVAGAGAKQKRFDEVPLDLATAYAAEDADVTLRLYRGFKKDLESKLELLKLYNDIEMPLVPVLTEMERTGVLVNRERLASLTAEFSEQISLTEQDIYKLVGHEFNVNSPAQLGVVMFDEMKLTVGGKKPKSTNVTVLEKLAEDDNQPEGQKLVAKVLEFRSLSKLRSTYTDALQAQINPKTGRVHTSYNQTGAATGRFSSSDPNLQNIPIRTENGRRIRRAFVPQAGYSLLAADYSQIELRLLAHFSGSPNLVKAFREDIDIHSFTASLLFDVKPDQVDREKRRVAKIINFGLIYGMGPVALSRNLGIGRGEAQEFINRYFKRFDGVKDYMENVKEQARELGYVTTLLGRRVHLPEIKSSHPGLRAGAERAAGNAPLQGSNADIIKKAMPEIEAKLILEDMQTRLLMQVHDELVLEVPEAEKDKAAPLIRSMMEQTVTLKVPLKVDANYGQDWEEAH